MKNYFCLGKTILGKWVRYVYLDTEEFVAWSLLYRYKVHVKIETIFSRDNDIYGLVALKVLKEDEKKFLKVMEELKGKMLLCGYRDYENYGEAILNKARDLIREQAAASGRVDLPKRGHVSARQVCL